MSILENGIEMNENQSISFGDYNRTEKLKVEDKEILGDVYRLKTFKDITRLKKNENLIFESVPGTTVREFTLNDDKVCFKIEGNGSTQILLESLPDTEYKILVDDVYIGSEKSSVVGKIAFSIDLDGKSKDVLIKPVK